MRHYSYYIHGVLGVLKAFFGVDKAPRALRKKRLEICKGCPDNQGGKCYYCGCLVRLKTKIAFEECDAGRWPEEDDDLSTFVPDYFNLTDEQKRKLKEDLDNAEWF